MENMENALAYRVSPSECLLIHDNPNAGPNEATRYVGDVFDETGDELFVSEEHQNEYYQYKIMPCKKITVLITILQEEVSVVVGKKLFTERVYFYEDGTVILAQHDGVSYSPIEYSLFSQEELELCLSNGYTIELAFPKSGLFPYAASSLLGDIDSVSLSAIDFIHHEALRNEVNEIVEHIYTAHITEELELEGIFYDVRVWDEFCVESAEEFEACGFKTYALAEMYLQGLVTQHPDAIFLRLPDKDNTPF